MYELDIGAISNFFGIYVIHEISIYAILGMNVCVTCMIEYLCNLKVNFLRLSGCLYNICDWVLVDFLKLSGRLCNIRDRVFMQYSKWNFQNWVLVLHFAMFSLEYLSNTQV